MAFCSHCGRPAGEGEQFCAGCGAPLADAAAGLTTELRRQGKQMQVLVGAAVLILAMVAGIVVFVVTSKKPVAGGTPAAGATAAPQPPAQAPPAAAQSPSDETAAPAAGAPAQAAAGSPSTSTATATPAPAGGIDLAEVQKALAQMTQRQGTGNASAPAAPSGSDRYPGSQPVNVDDASLPDIGIPVAREVYSTTDSVATVLRYYQQRYPDAQVTEINGQKIVAVQRPGLTKVIAIGTNGQETRIAIVQPGS